MVIRIDNNSGEVIAIKVVNLENDAEGIEEIRKEVAVLSNCDFPHIIRYRGSYLVGSKLWIITDFCALGSLRELIVTQPASLKQCSQYNIPLGHHGAFG